MQIRVEIGGLDKLERGLKDAPAVMDITAREAMGKAVFTLEAAVKERTPRRTGRLFASVNGTLSPIGQLRGSIATHVNYAPHVELGRGVVTAQHMTAKGGRGFLRFRGLDGRWVFRRSVGPARGRFMFREGLAASREAIDRYFREAAKRVAESITKGI